MNLPIIIREHRDADVEPVHLAIHESMNELIRWMPWCYPGYSLADAHEWVSGAQARFAERSEFAFVISNERGDYLGGCGLNQIRSVDRVANLGYWVRSSQASRGVATRAAQAVADWAFAQTDLIRLEILVAVDNVPSRRVAEKVGAHHEGVLRKRLFLGGRSKDACMYALFRPESAP